MYREEIDRAKRVIEYEKKKGRLSDKRSVILFGAGDYTRGIIDILNAYGDYEYRIVDNDVAKRGTFCKGIRVCTPDDIESSVWERSVVIICSHFWREMKNQLLNIGISEENIIVIRLETFEEDLSENIKAVVRGRRIYRRIKKKYKGYRYFLCPYTGTGDIYLIGTLLPYYLRQNNIEKFVLIVVSSACKKVSDIFGIENVEVISGSEECRYLTRYYMLCPGECDLKILNDSWGNIHTDPIQWFRGLHDMEFSTMFKKFVFDLPDDEEPVHPVFKDKTEQIGTLKAEYDMTEGRSVLLAPYSTTLTEIPMDFWEELVKALKEKGYTPYTNAGGSGEAAIRGTKALSFPLDMTPQLVSWMGCFIGVRSGLCDVISGATAKKIILYDRNNMFFNTSAYEYFSLRKTGLSMDAIEIEYD